MFVLYSKLPETDIFWNNSNINIMGFYNTIGDAMTSANNKSSEYIHSKAESGYKSRIENENVYVVSFTKIELVSGYIRTSAVETTSDIISFHIVECENFNIKQENKEVYNVELRKTNSLPNMNQKLLEELKIALAAKFKEC
jgi:hypothetical protein